MKQFEYAHLEIPTKYDAVRESIEIALNMYGAKGWELVHLEHRYEPYLRAGRKEPGLKMALMKREKNHGLA